MAFLINLKHYNLAFLLTDTAFKTDYTCLSCKFKLYKKQQRLSFIKIA